MKNLINFFFSFEKLMKEKLVIAFYWLAIIVLGLGFFSEALNTIQLKPLAALVNFINFFGEILLTLVALRLICEIAVAIFRINNNLSPDGGKSETANIDPIKEARKAAEATALKAREVTKTAGEKAAAINSNTLKGPKAKKEKSAPLKASEKTTTKIPKAKTPKTKASPKKASSAKTKTAPKTAAKKQVAKAPTLNKDGSPRKTPVRKKPAK